MQEGDTEVCYLANKDSPHISFKFFHTFCSTVPMTQRREKEPWQSLWAEFAGIGRSGGVDGDGDEMNLFLCSSTPMCPRVPTSNSRMAAPALTYKCGPRETQGTPVRAARRTPELGMGIVAAGPTIEPPD